MKKQIKPEYYKSIKVIVKAGIKNLKYLSGIAEYFAYFWLAAPVVLAFLTNKDVMQSFFRYSERIVEKGLFQKKALKLLGSTGGRDVSTDDRDVSTGNRDVGKIKDIILPIEENANWLLYIKIINDTFGAYLYNDNIHDEAFYDKWDKQATENLSQLKCGDSFDCTVHSGDVVLDLGAFIGDFSVLAAKMGAVVYAFEPTPSSIEMIKKTKQLNDADIEIVPHGVSDSSGVLSLVSTGTGDGNYLVQSAIDADDSDADEEKVGVVSLDEWCIENNVRPDFIKADIEGFERKMLAGAKYVLKEMAPKLCLCTYHLPDDPQVLRQMILEANPNYIIVQKRCKLYAVATG